MTGPAGGPVVRAAGGVVWRVASGAVEVLVVHRPAPHDDWSLPKGKLDRGERHRDAAVREVAEETGLAVDLGPKLCEVRYVTAAGEDKRVRWWAMAPRDPWAPLAASDADEVDALAWWTLERARRDLTWDSDRRVLDAFEGSAALLRRG